MKLLSSLLVLTSILSFVSAQAPGDSDAIQVRSHPRDLHIHTNIALEGVELHRRVLPSVPKGQDATKLHVWIRTDERPSTYDDRSGASHEGLNQLMKDTGGRHKDVVIGNPSKGYFEYGLQFNDKTWLKKPNGDGAAVSSYSGAYVEVKGGHEAFEHKGLVKDGRKTLKTISTVAESEIAGRLYNHKSYNCATFAADLVKKLV